MTMTVAKEIGERIRIQRKKRGLSIEQFAKELSELEGFDGTVSLQTAHQWENGRMTPKLERMIKISEYFEKDINYLIYGDNHYYYTNDESIELLKSSLHTLINDGINLGWINLQKNMTPGIFVDLSIRDFLAKLEAKHKRT